MTAYGSIETAVEAMRIGAFDFVQKPIDLEQIELRVTRALEHRRLLAEVSELREEQAARRAVDEIVGDSPALRAAVDVALRVAPTRSTVLVTGETGTGKELIAQPDPPLVAAARRTAREGELRGAARDAARVRALRTRARGVHRSRSPAHRPLRAGERRHALPRRGRGHVARDAGEAAARAAGPGVPAAGRDPRAAHRRAAGVGDEPGSRGAHARGLLPRGSVLPPERDPHPPPAVARAPGRSGRARPPLPAALRARGRAPGARLHR